MELTIVGTSHIAKQSIRNVKKAIAEKKPGIVAIELDPGRYYALQHPVKPKFSFYSMRRVGVKGFLFAMIGSWVSSRLGKMVGVDPGEDMLTASKEAKKSGAKIALIDQDIQITLRRFSASLSWKERWQFVKDIFSGIFFKDREMERFGLKDFDLNKVPSNVVIAKMMKVMKERYPNIYRVLVHERNVYMAKRLRELSMNNPGIGIVAVVGAGHVEGITEILSEPTYTYGYVFDAGTVGIDYSL